MTGIECFGYMYVCVGRIVSAIVDGSRYIYYLVQRVSAGTKIILVLRGKSSIT